MKTLSELRKACAAHGIKVSKKTLSFGPIINFEIDGRGTEGVLTRDFYEENRAAFEALERIKAEFHGMEIGGQKVYGLIYKKGVNLK